MRAALQVLLVTFLAVRVFAEDLSPSNSPQPTSNLALQTFSSIGKEESILKADMEVELFRRNGRGCLTHMWFAMDPRTRIRVYVDGEQAPSIDMAQDLGHGYAFGGPPEPWGVRQFGRKGGVYNNYRIPFGKEIKVTVLPTTKVFDGVNKRKVWWIIRGSDGLPVTVGGVRLPESARLRLHRLEGYRAKPLEEFDVCRVAGAGALYQVTLAVQGDRPYGTWKDQGYQEGCMRAYFGEAEEPTFLSSGLEDYFVSSGYFHHRKLFQSPVSGLTHIDVKKNRFSAYRFHDEDPVFFKNGLRLSLRCGEKLDGRVFHDPPAATYTVYAWVYEWQVESN
ncbi:MAG: DUF2961 domain-containing protein [Fuerstiella sp.]|nr:DUF2961 domain-containing protein [Fuerstiella sp.]MCP4858641.1 DUF2961 domain-containing protein [Fuerstiella sp.]